MVSKADEEQSPQNQVWLNGFPLVCQIELANTIENTAVKAQTLAEFARNYIEAGQIERGLELLEQAVQVANTKTPNSCRSYRRLPTPWLAIVEGYMAAEHDDLAAQFADKVESLRFGRSPLIKLALNRCISRQQYDDALLLAKTIEDEKERHWALVNLAQAYARSQQDERAFECVNQIQDAGEKENGLGAIVHSYVETRRFESAIQIIKTYQDPVSRVIALGIVAAAYAKNGQRQKATELFAYIESEIPKLRNAPDTLNSPHGISFTDPSPYVVALRDLAKRYANAEFFDKAVQTANQIEEPDQKAEALRSIALIAFDLGHREQAGQIAFSLKKKVKQLVLIEIASRYASAGCPDQALEIVEFVKDPGKNFALHNIAEAYRRANQLEQALQVATMISDAFLNLKGATLAAIARAFVQAGQEKRALKLAKTPTHIQIKAFILTGIAEGYAANGQIPQAVKLFNQISDGEIRIRSLNWITRLLTDKKQYQQGLQFLQGIKPQNLPEEKIILDQRILFSCANRIVMQ